MFGKLNKEAVEFLYEHGYLRCIYRRVDSDFIDDLAELACVLESNTRIVNNQHTDNNDMEIYDSMFFSVLEYHLHNLS